MKVFVSWSGEQSHAVALVLRAWLPRVIQQMKPWVSSEDIDKGAAWLAEITRELRETTRGIICVTPTNQTAPWLNFEAGAISHATVRTKICVALLGMSPADIVGPLRNFQATNLLDQADMLKLVQSLNADLAEDSRLSTELLEHAFTREWSSLGEDLARILEEGRVEEARPAPRSDRELLEEMLDLIRSMSRRESDPLTRGEADVILRQALSDLNRPLVYDSGTKFASAVARPILPVSPGDRVRHDVFGLGEVIALGGEGEKVVATIKFEAGDAKRLLLKYAPLELVEGEGESS